METIHGRHLPNSSASVGGQMAAPAPVGRGSSAEGHVNSQGQGHAAGARQISSAGGRPASARTTTVARGSVGCVTQVRRQGCPLDTAGLPPIHGTAPPGPSLSAVGREMRGNPGIHPTSVSIRSGAAIGRRAVRLGWPTNQRRRSKRRGGGEDFNVAVGREWRRQSVCRCRDVVSAGWRRVR